MHLKAVCIYQFGGTAYRGKIKTAFAFFDEGIFRFTKFPVINPFTPLLCVCFHLLM